MKTLFLSIFLFIAAYSFGQEWSFIAESPGGNRYYVKKNSMQNDDGYIKIWVKLACSNEQAREIIEEMTKDNSSENINKWINYEHDKTLYIIDCNNNRHKRLKSIAYSSDGRAICSLDYPDNKWEDIVPDSVFEHVVNAVCEMNNTKENIELTSY